MDLNWNVFTDHLFAKAKELEAELVKTPANAVATNASLATAAIVLSTIAKGIQKATRP